MHEPVLLALVRGEGEVLRLRAVPATVTVAVCVPYFSCQASIVYVPGGRPLIEKLPSAPLTA